MRDFDIVQQQKAIVHRVVSEFRPNVTNVYVLQWLMCFHVSYLNDEWMWSVGLPIDNQLRHDDRMVGCSPH